MRTSSSSHWKLTCSRHDIAELALSNNHMSTLSKEGGIYFIRVQYLKVLKQIIWNLYIRSGTNEDRPSLILDLKAFSVLELCLSICQKFLSFVSDSASSHKENHLKFIMSSLHQKETYYFTLNIILLIVIIQGEW